jgi:hypothetical protein
MHPYQLDDWRYYGYNSRLYKKWLSKVTRPKLHITLKDFKAVIVMDVSSFDMATWPKDKVMLTINSPKYVDILNDIKVKCILEEWYEECQVIEDLKELKARLMVYDILNEVDGIDVGDIQKDIIDKHDLDFK